MKKMYRIVRSVELRKKANLCNKIKLYIHVPTQIYIYLEHKHMNINSVFITIPPPYLHA